MSLHSTALRRYGSKGGAVSLPLAGEIRMFAGNYAPAGWAFCDGQVLNIADHQGLFALIGTTYGGDGRSTFALPDMRGRISVHRGSGFAHGESGGSELADISEAQVPGHNHTASAAYQSTGKSYAGASVSVLTDPRPISAFAADATSIAAAAGQNNAHDNLQPYLSIHYIIALSGDMEPVSLLEPFVGEVRLFAGNFAPKGWLRCDGQPMTVAGSPELFSVLGTTYGGDGRSSFSLPDIRGRSAMHAGHGDGLTVRKLGEAGGSATVELTEGQLPYHSHQTLAVPDAGAAASTTLISAPGGGAPGDSHSIMQDELLTTAGTGEPHNNLQPYLVLNYIIAAQGPVPA